MSVLVGQTAPDFTATAVMPDNSFKEDFKLSDYKGKYVVLFFYPLDFTFVCPSEIIAFDHRLKEFEDRGVQVIGASVDSHFTHDYDVLLGCECFVDDEGEVQHMLGGEVALRGSFLIDKEGNVRHQVVNDLPLGRNIDEMLRMVDALQYHEAHGEVCPAGWNKGKTAMQASPEGVASYLASEADKL